jgi:mannose-6-phosphate isomerase
VTQSEHLTKTSYVSNDFFTVEKWEISGPVTFAKTAPYTLASVLTGEGTLSIDGSDYPIRKGDHFILTSDIATWAFDGKLTLIASHDGE